MQGGAEGCKTGVARVVITPEQSMWLSGYTRDHSSEGTLVDLWAKALVLEDASGKQAVLVTTDILGFPKNLSDRIRDRLKTKFGLSRAPIILSSSHTHTGPVIHNAYNIYTQDPEQLKKIKQYADKLEDQIVTLVGEALHSMTPVEIYSQNGITRFQVNRRNNTESKLNSQTELKGPNDYAVPVLKVVNEAGDLIAVAFGYACHATTLDIYRWSGDYPGFAQIELEKLYPGATALFFQGAGADQNPLPRRTIAFAQQYGRELVIEYAIELKRIFGPDIFVLGYSNDVMAYIPSARILREGGYEGESSQIVWGLPSTWAANIEMVILQEVMRLAKQAGVPQPESRLLMN